MSVSNLPSRCGSNRLLLSLLLCSSMLFSSALGCVDPMDGSGKCTLDGMPESTECTCPEKACVKSTTQGPGEVPKCYRGGTAHQDTDLCPCPCLVDDTWRQENNGAIKCTRYGVSSIAISDVTCDCETTCFDKGGGCVGSMELATISGYPEFIDDDGVHIKQGYSSCTCAAASFVATCGKVEENAAGSFSGCGEGKEYDETKGGAGPPTVENCCKDATASEFVSTCGKVANNVEGSFSGCGEGKEYDETKGGAGPPTVERCCKDGTPGTNLDGDNSGAPPLRAMSLPALALLSLGLLVAVGAV